MKNQLSDDIPIEIGKCSELIHLYVILYNYYIIKRVYS